jgi:hypothetical protein
MKTLKHISVAFLIMLISGLSSYYLKPNNPIMMTFLFLIVGFFSSI